MACGKAAMWSELLHQSFDLFGMRPRIELVHTLKHGGERAIAGWCCIGETAAQHRIARRPFSDPADRGKLLLGSNGGSVRQTFDVEPSFRYLPPCADQIFSLRSRVTQLCQPRGTQIDHLLRRGMCTHVADFFACEVE